MRTDDDRSAELHLLALCRDGGPAARENLHALLGVAIGLCHRLCARRHQGYREGLVDDAGQEIARELLEQGAALLPAFDPEAGSLLHYLAHLVWLRTGNLLRHEQRQHDREHAAAEPEVHARAEDIDWDNLVREALPVLTPAQARELTQLAGGRWPAGPADLVSTRQRKIWSRIRARLAQRPQGDSGRKKRKKP